MEISSGVDSLPHVVARPGFSVFCLCSISDTCASGLCCTVKILKLLYIFVSYGNNT